MGTAGQDSESSEREHWYDEFARVLDEQGAEAAEALATTAREADSQNPWPYLALSGLRLRAGDRTGAEAMLADASERCHGDAVAAVMAGARWLDLDQPERTLGLLDGAVSADAAMAREPYQVLTRVRALRDLDRPAEAAQLAGEVTEAWREQPELADDLAKLIAQRAWALLDAEQPQDAAALLPTAPETDDPETRAELQFALGVALAAAGRIHEASDPLAGAEDWPLSDEDKGLALLVRGQALLAQQRPADAVADLRRALDLGDEARQQETRLHLALALVQSNSRSDEPAILLAGAEDWPLNDEEKGFALLVRGQALLAQERVAEAEHDLHTAAGLVADAVRPEAQLSLALAVAKLGRGDEALDLMDAVPVDRVPAGGTPIFGSIAAIAVTNGSEPRRVLDTLSRLATTVPNWTETFDSHLGRGYALLGVQNWTAAEPELQAAEAVLATVTSTVGEGPVRMTRATLVMLRAMAVRNQGRNAEAMSLFQTATQIGGPEWPGRGQSQLGEASAILSEQGAAAADRAQALLDEAVKASPALQRDPSYAIARTTALLLLRRWREVTSTADAMRGEDGQLPSLLEVAVVQAQSMLGDQPKAMASLDRLAGGGERHPEDAAAWLYAAWARAIRGLAQDGRGGEASARTALQRFAALSPDHSDDPVPLFVRALLAVGDEDWNEVRALLDRVPSELRDSPDGVFIRARALNELGSGKDAVEILDQLAARDPTPVVQRIAQTYAAFLVAGGNDPEQGFARLRRMVDAAGHDTPPFADPLSPMGAAILAALGGLDRAAAMRLVDLVLPRLQEHPQPQAVAFALALCGRVLLLPERAEDARAAYARAVSDDPDDADAWLGLGYAYLLLKEPTEGRKAFDRLPGTADADTRAQATLGCAAAALLAGDQQEAARLARGGLDVRPDDPYGWLVLGLARNQQGNHAAALDAYRRGWTVGMDRPADDTTVALAVGVSATLLEEHRAIEALVFLDGEAQARLTRQRDPALLHNRAVALIATVATGRLDAERAFREAAAAGSPAARAYLPRLQQLAESVSSWFGFWFGTGSRSRQIAGVILALLLAASLAGAWVAGHDDTWVLLAPVVVTAAALLLPSVTRFKVGDIEIEQPKPEQPAVELPTPSGSAVDMDRLAVLVPIGGLGLIEREVIVAPPAEGVDIGSALGVGLPS